MGSQTKEADDYKQNTFWREVVLTDDAPVTRHSPRPEEIQRRAYGTALSQGAAYERDQEEWPGAILEVTT